MIKKVINIDNYWKVIVYYDIDYNFSHIIYSSLYKLGLTNSQINAIFNNMFNKKAKAVTISAIDKRKSIVLFNKHKSYYDYINSIIHEAEHIKQSMLYYYNVKDKGEAPAYTVGYIGMMLLKELL